MDLANRISEDIKRAMHARETIRLDVLRAIRNEIIKLSKTSSSKDICDQDVIKIVKTQIKQRREAITMFTKGNRQDLVAKEQAQLTILESFLPDQLSEKELQRMVTAAISKCGASELRDMGKVMKEVMAEIQKSGKDADNSILSNLVKSQLENPN